MTTGNPIGVDFELMIAMMKRIADQALGLGVWPTEQQVATSVGTGEGVTRDFRDEVGVTATFLANAMIDIQGLISVSHDAVLAAVNELADRDESLRDEAALISQLFSSVTDSTASGAPTSTDTPNTTSFH